MRLFSDTLQCAKNTPIAIPTYDAVTIDSFGPHGPPRYGLPACKFRAFNGRQQTALRRMHDLKGKYLLGSYLKSLVPTKERKRIVGKHGRTIGKKRDGNYFGR